MVVILFDNETTTVIMYLQSGRNPQSRALKGELHVN
jgi:hypothetical protein